MADLSITASEVQPVSGSQETLIASEAIDAGEVVRRNSGQFSLAQADDAGTDDAYGVALNSAASGQPLTVVKDQGTVTLGSSASVAQGAVYVLSANAAGKIAPEADIATTEYVTVLGVGTASDGIKLDINISGVAHA